VDRFLETHPRLHLDYLPRYQPPQERIWRRVRYEATPNRWLETLDAIEETVHRITLRTRSGAYVART